MHSRAPRPPRGASRVPCRFYNTPSGCFRGDSCFYKHAEPAASTADAASARPPRPPKPQSSAGPSTSPSTSASTTTTNPSATDDAESTALICGVCHDEAEPPFGLLVECSHVFCLKCIKIWRNRDGKSVDTVLKNMHKTCPTCRKHSDYIIPSKTFSAHGTPGKDLVKKTYLANLAQRPCRYFNAPRRNPSCPFGNDCHFAHIRDGSRYTFSEYELEVIRERSEQSRVQRDARTIMGDAMDDESEVGRNEAYIMALIHGLIDEDEMREALWYHGNDYHDEEDESVGWEDEDDEDDDDTVPELIDDEDDDVPDLVDGEDDDDGVPDLVDDEDADDDGVSVLVDDVD